jgi:transcriptional regulator with XRE-family HTH domain
MQFSLATEQEIRRELAQRLRTQRLLRALPQEELALRAGVSLSSIKRLEKSGAAAFDTLVKVALALGLAEDFAALFVPRVLSIAQMEHNARASQVKRVRAPRRSSAHE